MSDTGSPLGRSIGWTGTLRSLVAVAATMVVGAAFYDGRYGLGAAGAGFIVVAVVLAIRARRARGDADSNL